MEQEEELKKLNPIPIIMPLELPTTLLPKQDIYRFMVVVDLPAPPNLELYTSTTWLERTNRNLSFIPDYIDILLFLRPFLKYLFPIIRWIISILPKSNSINFYKSN